MHIIDAWVNGEMPSTPAGWQKDVAERLFKRTAESIFRKFSAAELLASMDEAGVDKAILTLQADRPSKALLSYAEQHPGRFAFSVLVDPRRGMGGVRQLEAVVRAHDVRLARVIPSMCKLAPDDRCYYPLYAKCVELDLPISINTGIPGPLLPAKCQDPLSLDEVCLFFPELTVIMANGADPWWDVAISLMAKYPRLYLMTSAFAPKYLPQSLIRFMAYRGRSKVMFASDFPFLTMSRCASEARQLDLPSGALESYLHDNAARVLFRATDTTDATPAEPARDALPRGESS
jgi:uncharacterized protein